MPGARWIVPIALLVTLQGTGAAAAAQPPAGLQPQAPPSPPEGYDTLVSRYRGGLVELAVRELASVTSRDLDGIRQLWFGSDHARLHETPVPAVVGAGMLHTECAFSLYRRGDAERAQEHFYVAWQLIDASAPDEFRRRWYLASGMFLHSQGYVQNAASILEAGVAAFPDDAALWLERGAVEESRAEGAVPWIDLIEPFSPAKLTGPAGDPSGHLTDAETYLERAANLDGTLVEATLRLARVRGEFGRRDAAAEALSRILAADLLPPFRYLANLFLGRVREREGRLGEAATRYREALETYPRGQAARTALALVLRRQGDRLQALDVVRGSLTGSVTDRLDDPWRAYWLSQFQSVDRLVAILRKGVVR